MRGKDRRLTRRQAAQALIALGGLAASTGAAAQTEPKPQSRPEPKRIPAEATPQAAWLTLPPTPSLPATARSGLAAVNGVSLFHARFGEGPPVVLLHGGLGNSSYWGHQVAALAPRFTVIVTDTRGHGRSPVMSHRFGYDVFADDVAALMDALQVPAFAIVGWSDGAITGLQLAITRPERVTKLFCFGANATVDGMKPDGARSRVFAAYAARCKAEYAQLSPHPERWPQLVDGMRPVWRTQPAFARAQLERVKAPTAISDGEHDEIIKREHTARMARDIPGAQLMILPQVSHFAMLQNPDQFNRAVVDFLAG
jgi:pimeloyl-ACP methyl ester carboxylesterase